MYNITYISDIDRARLVALNEAVRSVDTAEGQSQIREEIAELEGKRKSLHECTLLECSELRTFIWAKFDRLNRTGKYNIAHQFKVMLRQIEIRQGMIHQEMAREEALRKMEEHQGRTEQAIKSKEKQEAKRDAGKDKTGTQSVSSRWTTGIGSLD